MPVLPPRPKKKRSRSKISRQGCLSCATSNANVYPTAILVSMAKALIRAPDLWTRTFIGFYGCKVHPCQFLDAAFLLTISPTQEPPPSPFWQLIPTMVWVSPGRKTRDHGLSFPFLYRLTVLLNSGGSNSPWSEFWSEFPHFMGMGVVSCTVNNWKTYWLQLCFFACGGVWLKLFLLLTFELFRLQLKLFCLQLRYVSQCVWTPVSKEDQL